MGRGPASSKLADLLRMFSTLARLTGCPETPFIFVLGGRAAVPGATAALELSAGLITLGDDTADAHGSAVPVTLLLLLLVLDGATGVTEECLAVAALPLLFPALGSLVGGGVGRLYGGFALLLPLVPPPARGPAAPSALGADAPHRGRAGVAVAWARPRAQGPGWTTPSPGPQPTCRRTACPSSSPTMTSTARDPSPTTRARRTRRCPLRAARPCGAATGSGLSSCGLPLTPPTLASRRLSWRDGALPRLRSAYG